VAESDRITEAIAGVRAAGYEIVLKLDATIGLARRESQSARITSTDRHFLESLHIQVDHESLDEERQSPKFEMTPQDVNFLKSLKISAESGLTARTSNTRYGTFWGSTATLAESVDCPR
jgi:hypothetical protein